MALIVSCQIKVVSPQKTRQNTSRGKTNWTSVHCGRITRKRSAHDEWRLTVKGDGTARSPASQSHAAATQTSKHHTLGNTEKNGTGRLKPCDEFSLFSLLTPVQIRRHTDKRFNVLATSAHLSHIQNHCWFWFQVELMEIDEWTHPGHCLIVSTLDCFTGGPPVSVVT